MSRRGAEITLSNSRYSNWRALTNAATISPSMMALNRSANTVSPRVMTITTRCSRCTRWIRVMNLQSMMSQPTFIRMPARTAWGISPTYSPSPRTRDMRTRAQSTPDTGVLPPIRAFTTVAGMFPAPGMPPKSPETMFPTPWPISSRFGL